MFSSKQFSDSPLKGGIVFPLPFSVSTSDLLGLNCGLSSGLRSGLFGLYSGLSSGLLDGHRIFFRGAVDREAVVFASKTVSSGSEVPFLPVQVLEIACKPDDGVLNVLFFGC